MTFRNYLTNLVWSSLLLLPAVGEAATPAPVAQIAEITGNNAEARTADGVTRRLEGGGAIFVGERVRTGAGTRVRMDFTDEARFYLGPNAEFEVENFQRMQQGAGEDAFHSRVIKGTFRFVSGLIARSTGRNMRIAVSVATIGIRGTHVAGEVTDRESKDGVTVDASARVVLLEPEQSGEKTAIVVENKFGSVVIDQPGYGTEIPDEKSPPSPVRRMQLRTIDNVQRSIRAPVRQGGPRPR
jgi:hypothetical protein